MIPEEEKEQQLERESFFSRVEVLSKKGDEISGVLILANFDSHPVNIKADFKVGNFLLYSEAHPDSVFVA